MSDFGAAAKAKLINPGASGQPEDQLRGPLERLFEALAAEAVPAADMVMVGESSLADLRTRPDYSVTVNMALMGFVEVKAPGKGADPRRWKAGHDKEQWERLKALPNLLYTDGNAFSLWRNGEPEGDIVKLRGDIENDGSNVEAPGGLLPLLNNFLTWTPTPPRSARELAEVAARLSRFLRDEVIEQMERGSTPLRRPGRGLARPAVPRGERRAIRRRLCPGGDLRPADGEVQGTDAGGRAGPGGARAGADQHADRRRAEAADRPAGTGAGDFARYDGPRARRGRVGQGLEGRSRGLALFLRAFPGGLRQQPAQEDRQLLYAAGSGPGDGAAVRRGAEIVAALRVAEGLAGPNVHIADPAAGSGTFLLGVLRRIAEGIEADQGEGAVARR
ncbi:MAG: hypothetical protein WDN24_00800 [Sphingomonas sp.]